MCLVTLARILSTFPLFVSFAIFRTVSKIKKKGCLVRISALSKFFLNSCKRFTFLMYLKNDYSNYIAVNFFFTILNTQIPLSAHGYSFLLSQPFFRIFFPIKPTQRRSLSDPWKHKVPQSILYMDCYFSQAVKCTTR